MLYEAASWDTHVGGPLPGAVALRDYTHTLGFSDAGIFHDRAVRGTTAVASVHREGRALDITTGDNTENDLIDLLLELIAHCEPLGIQQVIYQRAVWTIGKTWRPYSGTDPHTTHAHVELTWEAAQSLTVEAIRSVLEEELRDDQIPVLAKAIADAIFAHEIDDHSYDSGENSRVPFSTYLAWLKAEAAMTRKAVQSRP